MDKLRTTTPKKKKIRGIMEELTGCGSTKKNTLSPRGNDDKLKKLIVNEYEDVMSPGFFKICKHS